MIIRKGPWHLRVRCKRCGWSIESNTSNDPIFHTSIKVDGCCPKCANPYPRWGRTWRNWNTIEWETIIARRITEGPRFKFWRRTKRLEVKDE